MHVKRLDDSADSFDMTATLGYSRAGDSGAHEFIRLRNGWHPSDGPARRAARGRLQRPAERAWGGLPWGDSAGGRGRTRPNAVAGANGDHDAGAVCDLRGRGGCGCSYGRILGRYPGHSQRHRAIYAVRTGSAIRNCNPDVDANTCRHCSPTGLADRNGYSHTRTHS